MSGRNEPPNQPTIKCVKCGMDLTRTTGDAPCDDIHCPHHAPFGEFRGDRLSYNPHWIDAILSILQERTQ